MNEKKYQKRLDVQSDIISKKTEEIESLKEENEKLKLQLQEKDEIINSVAPLRNELMQNVAEVKGYKVEYRELINELRRMKEAMNKECYKGMWGLIKFLIK